MKRQVKLIEGLHITAQDKRNILDCIDYLAEQPASDDPPWLGRGKSPKRYAIEEDPTHAGRYRVRMREAYRTDFGERRERTSRVVVDVRGRSEDEPAPLTDLFA